MGDVYADRSSGLVWVGALVGSVVLCVVLAARVHLRLDVLFEAPPPPELVGDEESFDRMRHGCHWLTRYGEHMDAYYAWREQVLAHERARPDERQHEARQLAHAVAWRRDVARRHLACPGLTTLEREETRRTLKESFVW